MFKNEKINSIKKMITSVEEDLETVFSELLSILKKTDENISPYSFYDTYDKDRAEKVKNRVYEYFINNIPLNEIEHELSKEFSLSNNEIKNMVEMRIKILKKWAEPKKIYAAACMKQNGIKIKDIAKTLNVKPFQVSKMLILNKQESRNN